MGSLSAGVELARDVIGLIGELSETETEKFWAELDAWKGDPPQRSSDDAHGEIAPHMPPDVADPDKTPPP